MNRGGLHAGCRRLSASAVVAATVLGSACAAPGKAPADSSAGIPSDRAGATSASAATAAPADAPAPRQQPPAVENRTPFPDLSMADADDPVYGTYDAFRLKISYVIDAHGQLGIGAADPEPMLTGADDPAQDLRCTAHGAGFNQRTVWYPDTGIFVAGARLVAAQSGDGSPRPLLRMGSEAKGIVTATGPRARQAEYGYAPCVGSQRVRGGARTERYLNGGDRLSLRPDGGKGGVQTIVLPQDPRPFAMLMYEGRAQRAFVPAQLVLLTIDWPRRRAVGLYQITVPIQPVVASVHWSTTLPPFTIAQMPQMQAFNRAVSTYIATCPVPMKPRDPCANPNRPLPEILTR